MNTIKCICPEKFLIVLFCVLLSVAGCSRSMGTGTLPDQGRRYASPTQAVTAFNKVVQAGDIQALLNILGPHAVEIVQSGDPVADRNALSEFAKKMQEQNKLEAQANGQYVLLVGKDDWPFPIPLVQSDERWSFDTWQGKEEILNRRIGENELRTIRTARAYVEAQREYFSKDRNGDGVKEYAQKMASTPGKTDGLFWKSNNPKDQSPLGPMAAEAAAEGYRRKEGEPIPYHGYYYRILTAQGEAALGGKKRYINKLGQMKYGFALVAYPARWGASGIMTFIVNQDGLVYEKDLGVQTFSKAHAMKEFNPDSSWSLADANEQELFVD